MTMKSTFCVLLVFFLSVTLFAQDKFFTLEEAILKARKELAPEKLIQLQWIPERSEFSYVDTTGGESRLLKGSVSDTMRSMVAHFDSLNSALIQIGLDTLAKFPGIEWVDQNTFRFWNENYLILYRVREDSALIINSVEKEAENTDIEETYHYVAFTKGNNLFIALRPGVIKQITFDEDPALVNGQYVHRREFGIHKGTFWSPGGQYLAFYRKDERMVSQYPLLKINTRPARPEPIRYPMAGERSEQVQVGIYNLKTGSITYLQTGEPKDQYLTNITWGPEGKYLYVVHLNRDQNHLRLIQYDRYTGQPVRTLIEESDPEYVEPMHGPVFIQDNPDRFVWFSEGDGFDHLYLYDSSGRQLRQLTHGAFEITKLHGFDEKGELAFVTATSPDGLQRHVYSVKLSNGSMKKLTSTPGTHSAAFTKEGKYFFDEFSSIDTPRKISILDRKGKTYQVLLDAENPLTDYKLGRIKLLKLKNEEGTLLNARLIYPVDFDSTQKYPVIVYVYGGPHAQLIRNRWLGGGGLWFQYLSQRGYLVFTLDNRGSAYRGIDFEQAIFRRLGTVEVQDQMAGVEYLKSLPFVDTTRMGVTGWSYGGFMTISLMTRRPGVFQAAVCGGPVIDWRYYEVMYTERYMDTPEANPDGYSESSLLNYIDNLSGHLLIIHGTIDPTVVWQHSLLYLKEAVKKGKQLDYFVYPGHEHGVRGNERVHLYTKMTNYFNQYLKN